MVKTLQKAIAEVASLLDADQEEIGRKLLSHVEKLRQLRADIDAGPALPRRRQGQASRSRATRRQGEDIFADG
jgi:hypothetical protein